MADSRVAIVTGAARGIGAATAKRLAEDGFAVAVIDLDEKQCADTVSAIESGGGTALAVGCDVSDAGQVQAAVDRIAAELGGPTVLVNNAGVIRDNMLFKMSEDDWDTVMNVHLRGSFLMSKSSQAQRYGQRNPLRCQLRRWAKPLRHCQDELQEDRFSLHIKEILRCGYSATRKRSSRRRVRSSAPATG